jgi:hypothetical protein
MVMRIKMTRFINNYNPMIIIGVVLISITAWNLVYQQNNVVEKFRRPSSMAMLMKNNGLSVYQSKAAAPKADEGGGGERNERYHSNDDTNNTSATDDDDDITTPTPLFYHVSPGSTGSRALYHAACLAGYHSVHHKSFCISDARGTNRVSENVIRGLRSHFEIIRLYGMAYECCKLYSRGKLLVVTTTRTNNSSSSSSSGTNRYHLCYTPLHQWINKLQSHLAIVISSDLVGLFDTPYPYLAKQIVQLTNNNNNNNANNNNNNNNNNEVLQTSSNRRSMIMAMTERNATEWTTSRLYNHGVLLCRHEYSYELLGASEFDIIGCYERALLLLQSNNSNSSSSSNNTELKFWDVYWYRSHHTTKEKNINSTLQQGIVMSMKHHQQVYLSISNFNLDIFGIHSSTPKKKISENEIAMTIKKHILESIVDVNSSRSTNNGRVIRVDNRSSTWQAIRWHDKKYNKPLTCRGRVTWNMANDTLVEYYHIPKTCIDYDDPSYDNSIPINKRKRVV